MIIYTPMTKLAMNVCFEAHKSQRDKSGMPYIFHPVHLAEQMETEEEICVALLHDVVEDTSMTFEGLRELGFSDVVVETLKLLTHPDEVPYMDYVKNLAPNPIARKVKLADLAHNSDFGRLVNITQKDIERHEKYAKAIEYLRSYED